MQDSSWADRLELVGDDDRLVGSAGALPLRLLAERTGLRTGLPTAMTRRGFTPVYDRGQLLVDLAVTQILGGEAISDFQGLRHLAPVIGPIPSTPTVWRAMAEVGERQLSRINAAVTVFRRHWWRLLAARPDGLACPRGRRRAFRLPPVPRLPRRALMGNFDFLRTTLPTVHPDCARAESYVTSDEADAIAADAADEVTRREALYRQNRPPLSLTGRTAMVVDDGLATGATARAAVAVARGLGAASVVVAVPVAAPDAVAALRQVADDVVCPLVPADFDSVSRFYNAFPQISDDQVIALMSAG